MANVAGLGSISGCGGLIQTTSGDASSASVVTSDVDSAGEPVHRRGHDAAGVNGLATVALVGRHELDAAVAVSVVVPIHK